MIGLDRDREALARARETLAPWADRVELVHADYRDLDDGPRPARHSTSSTARWPTSACRRCSSTRRAAASASSATSRSTCGWIAATGDDRGRSRRPCDGARARRRDLRVRRRALLAPDRARHRRRARGEAPIDTTGRLAAIVRRAMPRRGYMRIDPATRTFQALRIWVNRELEGLDRFLEAAVAPAAGRRAARRDHVSFARGPHRQAHPARAGAAAATRRCKVLTKKPLVPSDEEVRTQPAGAQRQAAGGRTAGVTSMTGEQWLKPSNTPSRRTSGTTRSSAKWTRRASASCGSRSAIAGFLVLVLLFSAWQHFELLQHGYQRRTDAAASAPPRRTRRGSCGSRSRRCGRPSASRHWRPATAPRRADARRSDRHRTCAAGGSAGPIGRRPPVIDQTTARHPRASAKGRAACASRPTDWRVTREAADASSRRSLLGLWAIGIEARLVYLQVYRPRRSDGARGAAAAPDHRARPPSAATSSIGAAACSPRASTPTRSTRSPRRSPITRGGRREALRRARRLHSDRNGRTLARPASTDSSELRLRAAAGLARSRRGGSPTSTSTGIGFMKESRRFYPNRELARPPARLRRPGQQRARRASSPPTTSRFAGRTARSWSTPTRGATRSAASSVPPTDRRSTFELTIDEYLQHIAERELHAGVIENRAAGGSAIVMNPRTGEILAMANEPTFNPNAYRELSGDRIGATAPCRTCTSRARRSRSSRRRPRSKSTSCRSTR